MPSYNANTKRSNENYLRANTGNREALTTSQ